MIDSSADTYTWFENLTDLMLDLPEGSIVSRTLYKDKSVNVVLFGFAAGSHTDLLIQIRAARIADGLFAVADV